MPQPPHYRFCSGMRATASGSLNVSRLLSLLILLLLCLTPLLATSSDSSSQVLPGEKDGSFENSLDIVTVANTSITIQPLSKFLGGSDSSSRSSSSESSEGVEKCEDVGTQPDPCAYVLQNCSESSGFVNYLEFYYCVVPNNAVQRAFAIVFFLFVLIFLFFGLALTAEDFFCPSLSVISDSLQLSENVAGVTVLALGNGASDLVSTYIASQKGARQMAVGELLGAGSFVTSIVVGSIAILTPSFSLARRPFLRDVGFYVFSVLCLAVFLFDGEIILWESICLIGIYLIYVCTVIIGRNVYQSHKKKQNEREDAKRRLLAQALPQGPSVVEESPFSDRVVLITPEGQVVSTNSVADENEEYEEYVSYADDDDKRSQYSAGTPSFIIDAPPDDQRSISSRKSSINQKSMSSHLQLPTQSPFLAVSTDNFNRNRANTANTTIGTVSSHEQTRRLTGPSPHRRRLSSHSFQAGHVPRDGEEAVRRSRSAVMFDSPASPTSPRTLLGGNVQSSHFRKSFGGTTGIKSPMTTLAIIRDRALHYGDAPTVGLGLSLIPDIAPVRPRQRENWSVTTMDDGTHAETKKLRKISSSSSSRSQSVNDPRGPKREGSLSTPAGVLPSSVEVDGETLHTNRWRRYAEEERAERDMETRGASTDMDEEHGGVSAKLRSAASSMSRTKHGAGGYSKLESHDPLDDEELREEIIRTASRIAGESSGTAPVYGVVSSSSTEALNAPPVPEAPSNPAKKKEDPPSPSMSSDSNGTNSSGNPTVDVGVYQRKSQLSSLLHTVFPLPFVWKRKTVLGKIISIICVPIIFGLGCTVPVVLDDVNDEEDHEREEIEEEDKVVVESSSDHHAAHHSHHTTLQREEIRPIIVVDDSDDDDEGTDSEALLGGHGQSRVETRATASASSGLAQTVMSTDIESDGEDPTSSLIPNGHDGQVGSPRGSKRKYSANGISVKRPPGPIARLFQRLGRKVYNALFVGKRPKGVPVGGNAWNRWCVILQCFVGPTFALFTITQGEGTVGDNLPTWIIGPILGGILSIFVALSTTNDVVPPWYRLLAFPAFLIAMVWIYTFANEIVGLLEAFGRVFEISDALLGMTVLALGNSIGDTVSNIAIAKMGFPTMAVSACFGAPMLNMLLGIGISSMAVILGENSTFDLEFNPPLMLALGVLMTVLTSNLIIVPLSGFTFKRAHGFILLGIYFVFTVGNIVLELLY